jgi:CheY-like chemotaxis protein
MARSRNSEGHKGPSSWSKVEVRPERWEHPAFGIIVARGANLWSLLPSCGHDYYAALSLKDAQAQAERRSGLCFLCWSRVSTDEGSSAGTTSAAPSVASPAQEDDGPVTVLVVDDDIDIRDAVAETLEDDGYAVLTAANGAEALELLRTRRLPRVILLDLMMPLMDGYRFRAEQRKDPALATIPVIVITAGGFVRSAELEAVAIFRKPIDVPQLLTSVAEQCNA